MSHILMHRKKPVAEIQIAKGTSTIIDTIDLTDPKHLPIGVTVKRDGKPDIEDLNDWFGGRSIPASRQNIKAALQSMGIASTDKLLVMCYGLSLSDQYWVNPKESPLKWEDINFFENDFSEDVGDALFGNAVQGKKIDFVSPNNTSDGILQKKWQIINNKRCLIKGGSDPFYQQPFNETMTTIVMNRLNIPCVDYSVIFEDKRPYSICENFITSETELVSAFNMHNTRLFLRPKEELYEHYLECCEELGIADARLCLDKMLVADYLTMNDDRHLNNFGAVRNAESLKWLGFAPNFDNGSSFCNKELTEDILLPGIHKSQPFRQIHDEQIKLVKDFSWLDLSALDGIEDDFLKILESSAQINEQRRDSICKAFKNRITDLERFIK
ncbi:MAG: excisionase [Oscillospiraceae bacterium]|jgi:hypothetical protein|nr:excisionase [Oscillospiraceae bacterium]